MRRVHLGLVTIVPLLLGWFHAANGAAVMSVDLGSEWLKVGVVSPGVPMEIALNKESKRKTPAVIAFRDGVRYFGEDAQNIGVRFPANSYAYLIDLLGKTVDNPMVELYKKRFPYYEIEAEPTRRTVVFRNGAETFTVEELVAQFLQVAKEYAQDSTGQVITECVLTVPGFFGQAERQAILAAATLSNLKVLQLMNDYTAVALNYGIFQRKDINETAQYFIFYDMGAHSTSAVVVSYQLVKDKVTKEVNPVIQVLGVGFDRTLGGLEMQLRLRDYLAREFNALKKTKTDVFTNARAMAKLFKEAGRLKNVLSANTDHHAQIEGLIDEVDFRMVVSRDKFEELCADLFERVRAPLDRALTTSGLTLDTIVQVTLFGGGTRVPKVQERLREAVGVELGKNLNADEAATMGSVYRAADLATGFKVKKFVTRDAVLLPVQVTFERDGGAASDRKLVRRTLFAAMNSYPQKKVITFNKHSGDFAFDVSYADLDHLPATELSYLGPTNLSRVQLTNVAEVLAEQVDTDNVESKGIKAHFAMDESGVFSMTGVDLVLEKTVRDSEADDEDAESPLSKLGSTISKLFSSSGADKDNSAEKPVVEEPEQEATAGNETNAPDASATANATSEAADAAANNNTADAVPKAADKPKIVIIKKPIPAEVTTLYSAPLDGAAFEASAKKIAVVDEAEQARTRLETARNNLESFIIDAQQRLTDDAEYMACATDAESKMIRDACVAASDWLYGDGEEANAITYELKLREISKLAQPVYARHWEHRERPDALKALDGMLEGANGFMASAKNLTKDENNEKDVFTTVEIDTLRKVIKETTAWRDEEKRAQKALPTNVDVRLKVTAITDKMSLLDREVKYLVNKIKLWRPKVKPTKKPSTVDDNSSANETEPGVEETEESPMAAADDGDAPAVIEEPKPVTEEGAGVEETDDKPLELEAASTPHGEL